jgi:preprotein translocase subunit YajC
LFITPAFAQAAGAQTAGASDILMQVAPFALILIIMYFLIMRPQQRRAKAHAEMIKNIRRGDTIVLTGGLIGKVARVVDDGEVEMEIAPNVKVRAARQMISEVRAKGEPVKDGAAT